MRSSEHGPSTRLKKRLAHASAALLLVNSLASCSGEEARTCESPRASSKLFPADPQATADRSTWKNGIAIHTEVPTGADGVVVGYRGRNADTWHDSQPITPDRAGTIAVLVGHGPVAFSVHIVAEENSPACANAPTTTFGELQPIQPLTEADAVLPQW